jgi:hypothetical protein
MELHCAGTAATFLKVVNLSKSTKSEEGIKVYFVVEVVKVRGKINIFLFFLCFFRRGQCRCETQKRHRTWRIVDRIRAELKTLGPIKFIAIRSCPGAGFEALFRGQDEGTTFSTGEASTNS